MRVARRLPAAFGAAQAAGLRSAPLRRLDLLVPLRPRAGGATAAPAAAARPCLRWTGARPSSTSSSGGDGAHRNPGSHVNMSLVRALAREQGRSVEEVAKEMASRAAGSQAGKGDSDDSNANIAMYVMAAVIFMLGMSYAAVPLYQAFCQATGYGGTVQVSTEEKFKTMRPVPGAKPITVTFEATTSDNMPWSFRPQQRSVRVVPGETALAFYTAYNPTDKPITGVSTYNVTPMRVGVHFNKIQCFCFEEQRLRPNEEIDMPLFFYIDPDFCDDTTMEDVREVTLAYTFFRTGNLEDEDAGPDSTPATGPRLKGEAKTHGHGSVQDWTAETAAKLGVKVPERR